MSKQYFVCGKCKNLFTEEKQHLSLCGSHPYLCVGWFDTFEAAEKSAKDQDLFNRAQSTHQYFGCKNCRTIDVDEVKSVCCLDMEMINLGLRSSYDEADNALNRYREDAIKLQVHFDELHNLTPKEVLVLYIKIKLTEEDWHAVSDAANDLRVLDAKGKK